MAEPVCEFSDLPQSECAHCRGTPVVVPAQDKPLRTGPRISASYDSPCGWCPDTMETGERISYTEECGWVHADCAEEPSGPVSTPESMW